MTVPAAIADPTVGAPAPEFILPSTAGEVALASFQAPRSARVLSARLHEHLYRRELRVPRGLRAFRSAETIVLPITVDSVPTLKEYKMKDALRQDLLSDFKRDVSRAYGTSLADRFASKRAYFLIAKQGIPRWRHVEAALGACRDDAELLRQIGAL